MSAEVVLTHRVVATANYAYLPFEVPSGVTRLDVSLTTDREASVGIGLFDAQGHGYSSPGFRGITGRERKDFFIALDSATPGFTPGPIEPGTWTVIIPVFFALLPAEVTVRIQITTGTPVPPLLPGPMQGVVQQGPRWYRGDLHCHTEASSDAWSSGTALTPAGWAEVARDLGLDFLAMTDHNVISQNWSLASDAGDGVLLLAGEEMTNYFHGHATVSGLEPGQWLDFRQSPFGLDLPTGGARISQFLAAARDLGAFVSAAHPFRLGLGWQFIVDAVSEPAARPDGFEVWNGPWQANEEIALAAWDQQLRAGWEVVANGGSDLHGVTNGGGYRAGLPTTVVYAEALAREPLVSALRAGHSFITRAPDGVEIFLTGTGPGGQRTYTGGRLYGAAEDSVSVSVLVRRGGGMRLRLLTADGEASETVLESDEQTVPLDTTIDAGFVRAEVRREGLFGMEALTNPIRLIVDEQPADTRPEIAPPPQRAI
ncbi:MAG: PHP domain-containing protein [Nocardioidaceae bacterium]|nr:PHP domain-containing protein [Nocardioidaceae bacterium]